MQTVVKVEDQEIAERLLKLASENSNENLPYADTYDIESGLCDCCCIALGGGGKVIC
ncbi:MAG: hypothetical protein ACFFCW_07110 [Candidatus Hodarchaeota archaeon]